MDGFLRTYHTYDIFARTDIETGNAVVTFETNKNDNQSELMFKRAYKIIVHRSYNDFMWKLVIEKNNINKIEHPKYIDIDDVEYELIKTRGSFFDAISLNGKFSCKAIYADEEKEMLDYIGPPLVPTIKKSKPYGPIIYLLTEYVELAEMNSSCLKPIKELSKQAESVGKYVLINFEDLVIYNNKICIYNYKFSDIYETHDQMIDFIKTYCPEETQLLMEKINSNEF